MNEILIKTTGAAGVIPASDGRLTLIVPIQIKRRSGRPDEAELKQAQRGDSTNRS